MNVFVVECHDGEQRHTGVFTSYLDALQWAWWGHVCLSQHFIVELEHFGNCPECGKPMLVPVSESAGDYLHTWTDGESDCHAECCPECMAITARYESIQDDHEETT